MEIFTALGPVAHSGEDQDFGGLLAEIGGKSLLKLLFSDRFFPTSNWQEEGVVFSQ